MRRQGAVFQIESTKSSVGRKSMAKILIVETNPALRGYIRVALEDAGHTVFKVADQQGAMQMIAGGGIELVITALEQAEIDGVDLIGLLRQDRATLNIPVLILTDHIDDEVITRSQGAGATGLVGTRSSPEKLQGIVRKVLET